MEKRTLLIVIVGIAMFALGFIVLAIVLSEVKSRKKEFHLPESLDSSNCPKEFSPLPVVLISLDGFRPDYLGRGVTPVLKMLMEKGATAPFMSTSYPSITFPNHYTIVTGLYPASHGIIDNTFFDPVFNLTFSYSKWPSNQGRWWGGEPIWNTVQRHGLKSGTFFWPGSEADIGGLKPSYYFKYNETVTFDMRVEQVLDWLTLTAVDRPALITLYSQEPDKVGHSSGPDSEEVIHQLRRVDNMVKKLVRGLMQMDLLHCVNLIIVSDHGMTTASKEKVINLEEFIAPFVDKITFKKGIPSMLSLKETDKSSEEGLQKALSCKKKGLRVYRKEELPLRLHFSKNRRILDFVIKTDDGFLSNLNSDFFLTGLHGFDNNFPSMNSLFIAYGPSFRPGATIEPFQNIEVYNLMCELLNVTAAANNGTRGSLSELLRNPIPYTKLQKGIPEVLSLPDEREIPSRLKLSRCDVNETEVTAMFRLLKVTDETSLSTQQTHLPWGAPVHSDSELLNLKLLFHPEHITGYSTELKLPLWTSYSLQEEHGGGSRVSWMPDLRLPENASLCHSSNNPLGFDPRYDTLPLFMPEFVTEDSLWLLPSLLSNVLPVTSQLKYKWRNLLLDVVRRRLKYSKSPLNIVLGPVFDEDSNGLNDNTNSNWNNFTDSPTHLFAVVTRCETEVKELKHCPLNDLDAMGFVLPQTFSIDNCLSTEELALEFSATIRDIERVSGFQFYPDIPTKERLSLTLRVHQNLWPLVH